MSGSIQKRPNRPKPWRARYWAPDGKQKSKSFRLKVDAEKWLTSETRKMDEGDWLDPKAGTITLEEWSEKWMAGLHDIKPKTRAGYESLLRSRVLPVFGDRQLRQLTPAGVRSWIADMADEGSSSARIRQARQLLHQMLEVATVDGLIAKNSTKGVKAPKVQKRRQLFLAAHELTALADAAEVTQQGAGVLIRFPGLHRTPLGRSSRTETLQHQPGEGQGESECVSHGDLRQTAMGDTEDS